jgi:hypothetical protein
MPRLPIFFTAKARASKTVEIAHFPFSERVPDDAKRLSGLGGVLLDPEM